MRLLVGKITAAHHGGAGGVGKAHFLRYFLEHPESLGRHIAQHRQVARRGLQVLAEGEPAR